MMVKIDATRIGGQKVVWAMLLLVWSVAQPLMAQLSQDASLNSKLLIPQNLLKLMHAPEIHRELGLTESQIESLEDLFSQIDGDWFRSRNLPEDQQVPVVDRLELRVIEWMKTNLAADKLSRARELLYRSQGVRMLLHSSVQKKLEMKESQVTELVAAAEETQELQKRWMQALRSGENVAALQQSLTEATQRENQRWLTILNESQQKKVKELLGKEFATSGLTRVYPMAPELVPVDDWINSGPLKLSDLRGKIVLLHFYAFECHNCHANFPHYIRWHQEYKDRGVIVLGIQTPETKPESDVQRVREAAARQGLQFPILVDLGNKNWDAWSNTMWPTVYVIDQKGYLRHWWQGELNWQGAKNDETIDRLISQLLEEAQPS